VWHANHLTQNPLQRRLTQSGADASVDLQDQLAGMQLDLVEHQPDQLASLVGLQLAVDGGDVGEGSLHFGEVQHLVSSRRDLCIQVTEPLLKLLPALPQLSQPVTHE